ncbi:MAG: hypothetical protein U0228_07920 [Myxococcaceae bacterium]
MANSIGDVTLRKGPDGGVLFIVAAAALVSGGFVAMALTLGVESDDVLKVVGAAALCALALFGFVAALRDLTVIGTEGVMKRTIFKTTVLRFDDVTSVKMQRVQDGSSLNADLRTGAKAQSTTLELSDGQRSIEVSSGSFGPDANLESVAAELNERIAARLMGQLESAGTVELFPGLQLREGRLQGTLSADAVAVPVNTMPPVVNPPRAPLDFDADDDDVTLLVRQGWGYFKQGEQVVAVVSAGASNFYPSLAVLEQVTAWQWTEGPRAS